MESYLLAATATAKAVNFICKIINYNKNGEETKKAEAQYTWFDAEGDRIKVLAARPVETLPDVKHKAGEVLDAGNGAPIIACGIGALELVRLQRAGKSAMTGEEFQRGKGLKPGMLLL